MNLTLAHPSFPYGGSFSSFLAWVVQLWKKVLIWAGGSCLSPLKKKDGSERRSWKGTWSLHFHFFEKNALFIFFKWESVYWNILNGPSIELQSGLFFSPSSSYRPGWLPQPPEATAQPISAPPPPSDDPILAGVEEEGAAFFRQKRPTQTVPTAIFHPFWSTPLQTPTVMEPILCQLRLTQFVPTYSSTPYITPTGAFSIILIYLFIIFLSRTFEPQWQTWAKGKKGGTPPEAQSIYVYHPYSKVRTFLEPYVLYSSSLMAQALSTYI